MSGLNREKGLEKSDGGALNPEQRSKLRQLKVDVQKLDEKYIRVRRDRIGNNRTNLQRLGTS